MSLPPWFAPLLFAPFVGSFLGVLVARLPAGRPVAWARSACERCGHVLSAAELVPLVSWACLRGRCRHCGSDIGWFHPAIEAAASAVAIVAAATGADGLQLWLGCLLGWTLLTLAWIDWRHFILPDVLTLPLLLAGLAASAVLRDGDPLAGVAGAGLGFLGLRGVALIYRALRRQDGLGGGDAKLLAAGGAWTGAAALPWIVFAAALLGIALALLTRRRVLAATLAVPFGPPLAVAIWAAWLLQHLT